jgi:hypothetical protein
MAWRQPRLRFLLAILLWVAIGIAGIWVSASRVFTKHIELQYHDELYGHVRELTGLVQVTQDGHLHLSARFPIRAILNQCPASTGRSASITAIGFTPLDAARQTGRGYRPHARGTPRRRERAFRPGHRLWPDRPDPDGRVIHYLIATDKRYLDEAIAGFTKELTLWLLALAAMLVGTGLLAIVLVLRPLDRLGASVAALRTGAREPLEGPFLPRSCTWSATSTPMQPTIRR